MNTPGLFLEPTFEVDWARQATQDDLPDENSSHGENPELIDEGEER